MNARAFALLAALALAPGRPGERQIERRFTSELELRTDSFELRGAEEGRTVEQQAPHVVREEASELEVVDTLLDDEDPPARFVREYRTVAISSRLAGAGKEPRERVASGGLEGKRVTFERGEDKSYQRSCEDADVRAGQLKRLRAEQSLAELLAATRAEDFALEAGSSFELDGAACARLFSPGEEGHRPARAKVKRTKGGLDFAPAALTEAPSALLATLDGKLTATLRARQDDDELPLNAELEFRFEGTLDASKGLVAEGMGEAEDEVELSYEGTGTLAWDPDSGRVEVHLEGEIHLNEEFRVQVEGNGKTAEVSGTLAMTGDLELEAHEAAAE